MMTDLTFAVMKYGFLILLWIFVFLAIQSLRRDVARMSPTPRKRAGRNKSPRSLPRTSSNAGQDMGGGAAPTPDRPVTPSMPYDESGPRSTSRTSAPAASGTAPVHKASVLTIIDGPLSGTTYTLGSQPITIGRAPDNTVILKDEFASSHHARVYIDPTSGRWAIEDLGSTNGTVVDGMRMTQPVILPSGVPVRIGGTTFELR